MGDTKGHTDVCALSRYIDGLLPTTVGIGTWPACRVGVTGLDR